MPQKHDIGHQKRLKRTTPKPKPAVLEHARDLVERGLADATILAGLRLDYNKKASK